MGLKDTTPGLRAIPIDELINKLMAIKVSSPFGGDTVVVVTLRDREAKGVHLEIDAKGALVDVLTKLPGEEDN